MLKQEEQQILMESPAILGLILMDHGEQHALSEVARLVDAAESAIARAEATEAVAREHAEKNLRSVEACTQALQQRDQWRQRAEEAVARCVTWIPVVDQLPPTELRVLAAYHDGRITTTIRALYMPAKEVLCYDEYDEAVYDAETDQYYYPVGWYEAMEEDKFAFVGPLLGTVTHWAQLPTLPDCH